MWKKYTFIQARSKKNHRKKIKSQKKNYITGTALTELVLEAQTMETCRSSPASTLQHPHVKVEQGGPMSTQKHPSNREKKSNSEVRREKNLFSTLFLPFNCTVWGTAGIFSLSVPCNRKAEILITANFKLGTLKLAS